MRRVCLGPSEPVMPWTMTLEFSVRKIAICLESFRLGVSGGELGGAARGAVHGVHPVTRGWLASARMRRPSSALLPSSRTTSGLVASSPRSCRAETMPLATASQAVMPPKTLTKTLFTAGSERMISRPLAMTSAEAPPPMSRKLAGLTPPNSSPA